MQTKLTVLVENTNEKNPQLEAEHGLSFLIERGEFRLLFDCGQSNLFLENAKKMNVDISSIDTVLCSHSHYDHAAGFPKIATLGNIKKIITGKDFFIEKYSKEEGSFVYKGCGFDSQFLEEKGISHTVCEDCVELTNGIFVVTNFERTHDCETIPRRFYLKKNGEYEKDLFEDEICLVIENEKYLDVIVGCSHPGILNMLTSIKKRFNKPINSLWGGIHLVNAPTMRILKTFEELKNLGIKTLGINHCSGDETLELVKECDFFTSMHLGCGEQVDL